MWFIKLEKELSKLKECIIKNKDWDIRLNNY